LRPIERAGHVVKLINFCLVPRTGLANSPHKPSVYSDGTLVLTSKKKLLDGLIVGCHGLETHRWHLRVRCIPILEGSRSDEKGRQANDQVDSS